MSAGRGAGGKSAPTLLLDRIPPSDDGRASTRRWQIGYRETETRANPTNNQWFYYYAEAEDGALWAGPFPANVSNDKFQKCSCFGVHVSHGPQPYYNVGMRELDIVRFGGVNFVG